MVAASVVIVPVVSSPAEVADTSPADSAWLYAPGAGWREYFEFLLGESATGYLAINARSRSVASGKDRSPKIDELLGVGLYPENWSGLEEKRDDPPAASDVAGVLTRQQEFYDSMLKCDEVGVMSVFSPSVVSPNVDEAAAEGGRMEPWSDVLVTTEPPAAAAEGKAAEGKNFKNPLLSMRVAMFDASLLSDSEAVTTALETPEAGRGSLLATQRWYKEKESGEWMLVEHRTLPFDQAGPAEFKLVADRRGSVILKRSR